MEPTDKANGEAARLATLHSCRVLDTEAELIYDDITRLLALTCSSPISVISLVDDERLWLKSKVGVASSEVPRDTSFCTHTIVQPGILVVPDTLQDPRFCDNPKVRGKPNLRFYAGAPIVMSNGQAIGAVAVMDTQPRELTREQRETLLAMARQVASHLELRRRMHEQEEVCQRLEQTTERLDLVVAAAGAGIWDLDLGLDSLFVSERVFEMLGLLGTVGQVPLSAFWPIVHANDRRALVRAAIQQLRRGNAFDCELRCRHAQHGWRWYHARAIAAKSPQGGVRRLVGSLLDIHEQRRAQDSLQRVSRLLAESQALGRVGGWEWDLAGDTLFWTSETYRIYELSPADYQPTVDTAVAYFVPESRLRVRAALQDAVARGRAFSLELELVTARGRNIWVRATGGTVFADGKAVRVLGAFQNITEQRRFDQELLRAKEAAEAASESKSAFLAAMSHEIRTPMHTVLGYTDMLRDTELDAEQRECVAIIASSGNSLLRLIDDILDFSKVEAGKMVLERSTFDLHRVVLDVARMMQPQANQKGLRLRVVADDACSYQAVADPRRVHQVLVNLAGNAVKFTASGQVDFVLALTADRVRIEVRDTGIGIPTEDLSKLFQDFVQVDSSTQRRFGGTGLGLAISKQLVEAMGGTIGVASEVGVGSTFWVELLMASTDSQAGGRDDLHPPVVHAAENKVTDGRRVLVAEDNRLNLRLAVRVLETFGLQVDTAVDGGQAVRLACENNYDLVLMDCLMPDVDGFEATRRIRHHEVVTGAHIPIIALTANALPEDREACLVAGMDDFVSKPFTRHALLQAIERWLPPVPKSVRD